MGEHEPDPGRSIFRQEAISYHAKGGSRECVLPESPPAWTQWAFASLLIGIIGSALFLLCSGAITHF